jgi:hypothetical protein
VPTPDSSSRWYWRAESACDQLSNTVPNRLQSPEVSAVVPYTSQSPRYRSTVGSFTETEFSMASGLGVIKTPLDDH